MPLSPPYRPGDSRYRCKVPAARRDTPLSYGHIFVPAPTSTGFSQPREVEREVRPGVVERSRIAGDRRRVELDYGDGQVDLFEWQLYVPDELEELGAAHGLTPIARATDDGPSMRLVLQRDG